MHEIIRKSSTYYDSFASLVHAISIYHPILSKLNTAPCDEHNEPRRDIFTTRPFVVRALSPEKACRCFPVSSPAIQRQFHHGAGRSESLHKEISRLLLTTPGMDRIARVRAPFVLISTGTKWRQWAIVGLENGQARRQAQLWPRLA